MNIINMERGLGKTTLLVAISAQQNIPVVSTKPWFVQERADELGLKIPRPLSVQEAQDMPSQRVLVDDMDLVLRKALGCSIEACTISLSDSLPCEWHCPK